MLAQLSQELEDLVARTTPGVVGVGHRFGHGSGLVLAEDGYILTNAHVVAQRDRRARPSVRLAGGEALEATLVGADPRSDLAVLRVDGPRLVSLPLADSRRLRVGQLVVAIGNPFRFDRSVSLGVVSAIERSLPGPDGSLFEGLVQTDAAINPGNSGGPLLDATGAVVGINTAVIPFAQGIGFAIPAHTASWVSAVLIQRGEIRRPYLGISARGVELVPAMARELGQPRAVRVHGIGTGTPAAAAGLDEGDILLGADGSALASVDDLQRVMVLSGEPELRLDVLRHGERRAVTVRPRAA
jgi:S1-C subfamily serine protease